MYKEFQLKVDDVASDLRFMSCCFFRGILEIANSSKPVRVFVFAGMICNKRPWKGCPSSALRAEIVASGSVY